MEAKPGAAALCVLLVLLSTMPGKAAATSDFCKCYLPCYTDCRRTVSWELRFLCVAKCLDDCSPSKLVTAAGGDPSTMACSANSICNSLESAGPAPDRDDAAGATEACVRGCNMWRQHSTK